MCVCVYGEREREREQVSDVCGLLCYVLGDERVLRVQDDTQEPKKGLD